MGIYIDKNKPVNISNMKPIIHQDGDGTWEEFKPIQSLTLDTPNGLPGVPVSSDGNYTDASGQQWVCDEIDFTRGVYVQRIGETEVEITKTAMVLNKYLGGMATRFDGGAKINKTNIGGLCDKSIYVPASDVIKQSGQFYDNLNHFMFIGGTDDTLESLKAKYDGSKLLYVLAEPIEKPLSEAEINAYKALHTNKPNTSIHNSENAHMAVDYVADTKNYIDNKINKAVAELSAAILTQ